MGEQLEPKNKRTWDEFATDILAAGLVYIFLAGMLGVSIFLTKWIFTMLGV